MLGFGVLRFAQHEGKGGEEEKGRAYLVGDRRRQRGGGRRAADRQVVAARKEDQGRGETEGEGGAISYAIGLLVQSCNRGI